MGRRVAVGISALILTMTAPGSAADEAASSPFRAAQPSPHATESLLVDITRVGDRLVAVGENGHIVFSDSQGEQWTHANVPVSLLLTAVSFPSERRGYAVGHDGVILVSEDRGESWSIQLTGTEIAGLQRDAATARLARLEQQVDAAGDEEADLDLLDALDEARFEIEDLEQLTGGIVTPLLGVTFIDESLGYAFGAYGLLLKTGDSGETWELISGKLKNPDRYHFYDLAATPAGQLTITGEAGTIFASPTGDNDWQRVTIDYTGSLFGVEATPGGALISFGLRGKIFRSTDGGLTWTPVVADSQSTLTGGKTLSDGRIVLIGASGTVLVSDDDGLSFKALDSGSRVVLSGVESTIGGKLLVTGFGGIHTVAN